MIEFRWNNWNSEHVPGHGVDEEEAEMVVRGAQRPFPRHREDGKWEVQGRGRGGRLVQVVFVLDDDGCVYVIHARLLTENEKKKWRRKTKR